MTNRTKAHRSWYRLGLILGLLWLTGCTAYSQAQTRAEDAAREQSFQETMKRLKAGQEEAVKLNEQCNDQLRIGMTTTQVVALRACKNLVGKDGRMMAWNAIVDASGHFNQVQLGNGYLYFKNSVLVSIQR